jgi:hypothetical protein
MDAYGYMEIKLHGFLILATEATFQLHVPAALSLEKVSGNLWI